MFIFAEPPATVSLLLLEHQRLTRTKWNVPFRQVQVALCWFHQPNQVQPQRRLTGHMSNADVAQGSAFYWSCFQNVPFFFSQEEKKFADAFVVALKSGNNSLIVISAFSSVCDVTLCYHTSSLCLHASVLHIHDIKTWLEILCFC